MRKTASIPAVAALVAGSVVVLAPAAEARTFKTKIQLGKQSECYVGDKFCGPWFWLDLERDFSDADKVTGTLRDARGKKVKIQNAGADGDDEGDYGHWWYGPTKLKKGKYTFTFNAKYSGEWNCSKYFYEVCRWEKGYNITKSKTFTYKPRKHIRWTQPEEE